MRPFHHYPARNCPDDLEAYHLETTAHVRRNQKTLEYNVSSRATELSERNEAWATSEMWRNTPRLPFLPFKGLYVITCVDPRTDPAQFLGLEFSEAIVARTVGGRVTDGVIHDLAYIGYLVETIAPEGPYFEVAVIHHTDCGTRLLENPELRHGFAERSGYDEAMLARLPVTVPEETVKSDVDRILAAPEMSRRISISGHVYHTESGRLETVVEPRVAEQRGTALSPR